MKSKFMHVKRLVMPLMQAILLVSNLTGCGAVNQAQFTELINMADDVSVEMYVGSLAESGGEQTVWMSQTGVNSIANTEAKGLASSFVSGYTALKPAQTLMGVMTGNQSEQKYFMEPNAQLQQTADKSSEFQVAYTAANDMYNQISPDQLDVNETVQKLVKAALGSQIYYNTWQASFNGDGSHIADNFYNGQMTKLDMILQVFNTVYGYESIPGDSSLYGSETAGMIEAFKQSLSDLSAAIRDSDGQTGKQQSLADSIDNLLDQSDCENTIRKLMYMSRYMDTNPFENTTTFQTEDSSENVVDSMYFSNATKMDGIELVYNVVRDLSNSIDSSLKDKDYTNIDASQLGSEFKDLNGNKLSVKQLNDLYTEIITTDDGNIETQRDKVDLVREYQSYKASDSKAKNLVLTTDQWAVYQDAKANTDILNNLTASSTADNRLLGNLSVTDLYGMLLGASSDMQGYSNELATNVDIDTGQNNAGDETSDTYIFDFEKYVYQYEMDNGLEDGDILGSEESKEALYQWLQDNGALYIEAVRDKQFGCTSPFIDGYIAWLEANDPTLTKADEPESTENQESTDTGSGSDSSSGSTDSVSPKDYIREDGTFDYDAYYKATGTDIEAERKQIDEATEKAGGERLNAEESAQWGKEAEEFSKKVNEVFESGALDDLYNQMKEAGTWVD